MCMYVDIIYMQRKSVEIEICAQQRVLHVRRMQTANATEIETRATNTYIHLFLPHLFCGLLHSL